MAWIDKDPFLEIKQETGAPTYAEDVYLILSALMRTRNLATKSWLLEKAGEHGLLPKFILKDQVAYRGYCRNAVKAKWEGKRERFLYSRRKGGAEYTEEIPHPEDDDGSDFFVPMVEDSP